MSHPTDPRDVEGLVGVAPELADTLERGVEVLAGEVDVADPGSPAVSAPPGCASRTIW
ncbi:MAG: hypothetical protein M3P39_08225 [Actinomycetota bacterium]|nr:hypothetical protein [Actinomycetota bacterium]